jgi:hypothetical protein
VIAAYFSSRLIVVARHRGIVLARSLLALVLGLAQFGTVRGTALVF